MYIYFSGEGNIACFLSELLSDPEFSSPLAVLPECAFLLLHVDFGVIVWKRR